MKATVIFRATVAAFIGAAFTLAAPAGAQSVSEYPIPPTISANGHPNMITVGPNGVLWFTEFDAPGNRLGRLDPNNPDTVSECPPLPTASSNPRGLILGPDSNIWFVESSTSKIGRITESCTLTEFGTPTPNSYPARITFGADGNFWFTEHDANRIGRITLAGTVTECPQLPTANGGPAGLSMGPDGNLWFTEYDANRIGKITPACTASECPALPTANSGPIDLTLGPDGNLWFVELNGNRIGRVTPACTVTEFPLSGTNCQPARITPGPDGNVWFTEANCNRIGRISPTGVITEFPIPTANSIPIGITTGPDGNLWFAEGADASNQIGRLDLSPQPQMILLGHTVAATISVASEADSYRFSANAGDAIAVAMTRTSGPLAPEIKVYDASGGLVPGCTATPSNCTEFGYGAAEIGSCGLAIGGTYTILVDDCGNTKTGDYNLYLQRLNLPGGVSPVSFGETVSATIGGAAEKDSYTFFANAGAVVAVAATRTSGSLAPEIRVYDTNGALVPGCAATPSNCTEFGYGVAEIGSCSLTVGGTYTILVDDCGNTKTGNYNLSLTCLTPPCDAGTTPTTTPTLTSTPAPTNTRPSTPTNTPTPTNPRTDTATNTPATPVPTAIVLRVGDVTITPGQQGVASPILLTNNVTVRGVQFDLTDFPDEITLSAQPACNTTSRTSGLSCDCNETSGVIHCVLISTGGARITSGTGQIATVLVDDTAPLCTRGQTVQLNLSNTAVADENNNPLPHTGVNGTLRCGCDCDLNCQATCDIFDALICVDIILGRNPTHCSDADLDGNGRTDIFDCLLIVDSILGRRPACAM